MFHLTISILANLLFWIYSHLTTKLISVTNSFFYLVVSFRTLATWRVHLYAKMIICFSCDKNEQIRDAFDHGERNCTMTASMDSFTFVGNMASLPLLSKLIFIYSIVLYFVRLLCLCFHFIINVDLWFESLIILYVVYQNTIFWLALCTSP